LLQYVDAKLNAYDEQRAHSLQCATPNLSAVDNLATDLKSRETQFAVDIKVTLADLDVTSTSATSTTAETNLKLAAPQSNNTQSVAIQHWRFDLVRNDGWRVCSAQRTS
jgi:hypothetical protein